MPYRDRDPPRGVPLWGVYTRCTVEMVHSPTVPPESLVYFTLHAAPYHDETIRASILAELARLREPTRSRWQRYTGLDTPTGTVIGAGADRPPCTRALTPQQVVALEDAFLASRAAEGPEIDTEGSPTADYRECVHVGGWFGDRPFQVRYAGMRPYKLVGPDAAAWQHLLAMLDALANPP